jgi:DNA-binding transcriptional regulator YhcF (GntR family)
MTQEFMAMMLGVHRPTVSTTASLLQQAGLISYSRGQVTVINPEGLKAGACECLELMERQFDKIFDRSWRELARRGDEKP